jgi:FixJ family two-component response regulator
MRLREEHAPPANVSVTKPALIVVVDDDASVRTALHGMLRSVGLCARTFGSAEEFLASGVQRETGCLITDIRLRTMSGLELQATLVRHDVAIPTIFITAAGDARLRVQAMRAGAVAVLEKPFDDDVLLETIHMIIAR